METAREHGWESPRPSHAQPPAQRNLDLPSLAWWRDCRRQLVIRHRALHEVECPKAIPCFSSHVAVFDTISNCNVSLRGPPPLYRELSGAPGINRAYSEGVWIPFWTPNCAGTGPERSKKLPRRPKTLPRRAQDTS